MAPTVRHRPGRGWSVRFVAAGQRVERGGFGEGAEGKAAAEAYVRELELGDRHADQVERLGRGPSVPVASLLREWMRVHGPLRSERTRITDRARVERLALFFGAKDARQLSETDLVAFATATMAERSAHVAMGCLSTLRRVLNLAARAGRLRANPVPELNQVMRACRERGRDGDLGPDAWTHEETAALCAIAEAHAPAVARVLRVALATGMRRGELLALRWEDVDLARGRLLVRRTLRAGSRTTKAPKAGRGRQTPIAPAIAPLLAGELERQRRAALEGKPEPEWVFPAPEGAGWMLWEEHNFSRAWRAVRRRALARGVRPLKFHSTRHTFITWGLEYGVSVKRLAEWVGASIDVLERHYAHVLPQTEVDLSFVDGGSARSEGRPGRVGEIVSTDREDGLASPTGGRGRV